MFKKFDEFFVTPQRQLKALNRRDPAVALNENFLSKLQDILVENLLVSREEVTTIEACLATYVKHEEKMQSMVSSCANLENFKKVQEAMKEM